MQDRIPEQPRGVRTGVPWGGDTGFRQGLAPEVPGALWLGTGAWGAVGRGALPQSLVQGRVAVDGRRPRSGSREERLAEVLFHLLRCLGCR